MKYAMTKYGDTMSSQVLRLMAKDWEQGQQHRSAAIDIYLNDLERLERQGKRGGKYWNFIVRELDALGHDRDYQATDTGNYYEPKN